jgi:hypothetical protein
MNNSPFSDAFHHPRLPGVGLCVKSSPRLNHRTGLRAGSFRPRSLSYDDAPPLAPLSRQALKVLLVDDDSFQLELITSILRGQKLTGKATSFNLVWIDLPMQAWMAFNSRSQ